MSSGEEYLRYISRKKKKKVWAAGFASGLTLATKDFLQDAQGRRCKRPSPTWSIDSVIRQKPQRRFSDGATDRTTTTTRANLAVSRIRHHIHKENLRGPKNFPRRKKEKEKTEGSHFLLVFLPPCFFILGQVKGRPCGLLTDLMAPWRIESWRVRSRCVASARLNTKEKATRQTHQSVCFVLDLNVYSYKPGHGYISTVQLRILSSRESTKSGKREKISRH